MHGLEKLSGELVHEANPRANKVALCSEMGSEVEL